MTLAERIAEAIGDRQQADIARAVKKSESAVTQWLDGSTKSLKADSAARLEQVTGYRANWIISGKGPKLVTQVAAIGLDGNPDYPAIRRVRFKLSAGASGFGVDFIDDDAAPIVFQREWFEGRGFTPDKLFAVKVANGSMEPGLYDGDVVVVNTGDTSIKDGVVYAMNYEGELVIKRLIRDDGQWWLSSDNPDQRRNPRKICGEDVFCVGRIVHKQSERI